MSYKLTLEKIDILTYFVPMIPYISVLSKNQKLLKLKRSLARNEFTFRRTVFIQLKLFFLYTGLLWLISWTMIFLIRVFLCKNIIHIMSSVFHYESLISQKISKFPLSSPKKFLASSSPCYYHLKWDISSIVCSALGQTLYVSSKKIPQISMHTHFW